MPTMPVITAATPNPVTIDPDITIPRRHRPGIHYIRRLIGHIPVDGTPGDGKTARYSYD